MLQAAPTCCSYHYHVISLWLHAATGVDGGAAGEAGAGDCSEQRAQRAGRCAEAARPAEHVHRLPAPAAAGAVSHCSACSPWGKQQIARRLLDPNYNGEWVASTVAQVRGWSGPLAAGLSSTSGREPQPLELARETLERIQTLGTVRCKDSISASLLQPPNLHESSTTPDCCVRRERAVKHQRN